MGRLTATAARTEATLESERRKREEQEGLFDRQLDRMTERFEALSEVITKRRADELTSANKQELDLVLAPLRASIDKMDLALKSTGETNARRSGELDRQIRMLIEQTTAVGDKADRLARAMSTSGKVQGDWGEKRLEQILQREGFIRGTELRCSGGAAAGRSGAAPRLCPPLPRRAGRDKRCQGVSAGFPALPRCRR